MKKQILEMGQKMAKLEGLKEEIKHLRVIVEMTIDVRDREGFEIMKVAHNNKVQELKELQEEIEQSMEGLDKAIDKKIEEFSVNIPKELTDILMGIIKS